MSYISRNLEPGERVLARARYHWWVNLRSLGLLNLFDHLWVTDRRILRKQGVLAARTQSISLAQLESKDVVQSLWGRVFGFGDLVLHGSGDMTMRFRNLANPVEISRAIGRAAAESRGGGRGRAKALRHGSRPSLEKSLDGQTRAVSRRKASRLHDDKGPA